MQNNIQIPQSNIQCDNASLLHQVCLHHTLSNSLYLNHTGILALAKITYSLFSPYLAYATPSFGILSHHSSCWSSSNPSRPISLRINVPLLVFLLLLLHVVSLIYLAYLVLKLKMMCVYVCYTRLWASEEVSKFFINFIHSDWTNGASHHLKCPHEASSLS